MVNIELLDRALNKIEDDPKHWQQSNYATRTTCGTKYCLAGWVCVLSGKEIYWVNAMNIFTGECIDGGLIKSIHSTAKDLLEISGEDALWLFGGNNSFEELQKMRKHLQEYGNLEKFENKKRTYPTLNFVPFD